MKTIKYLLFIALVSTLITACNDLELEPKGILAENLLFKSEVGVQQYFARVYVSLPIEDFNYYQGEGYKKEGNAWEGQKNSPSSVCLEGNGRGENMDAGYYWPYSEIRYVNTFLSEFPNYRENYTEADYEALLSEGYFIRAFYYFGLVKRFGGVPLISTPQDPKADSDSLKVPRSTEYDTYKFIYRDLKYAMEHGSTDKKRTTRGTAYAAAALMSRVMLYAASSANYGWTVGTTGPAVNAGLMIIPQEYAEEFYQYAYDACKFLHDAGFKLHTAGDAETAFVEALTNDTEEDIFMKRFGNVTTLEAGGNRNTGLFHSWDAMTLPLGTGLSSSVGCALQGCWESAKLFQMPAIVDEDGKPIRFNNPSELWNTDEMEGRARATFFFSGMTEPVSGEKMDFQAGIFKTYGDHTQADGCPYGGSNDFTNENRVIGGDNEMLNGMRINGRYGMVTNHGDEGWNYMGIGVRKYVGTTTSRGKELHQSSTNWKVLRYGEVLCNWAEAAYELGNLRGDESLKQEAITHINELHARAGARPYVYKTDAQNVNEIDAEQYPYSYNVDENLQYIRDERVRELCFENQHYWDLRRWRVYHDLFQNTIAHCLSCYYVLDEDKYIFLPDEPTMNSYRRTFYSSQYYKQIGDDEINKNDLIIRNDGF